ncbi:MAG: type II secretion system GspH family protein [Bacilli bacterium]|nr:type II secretion system GspH family protein [Bacilli bacterium]
MRKVRKGFTLIEATITIGILGLVFGLVAVGVSQLGAIQDSASNQVSRETKLKEADEFFLGYVSFVSLENPEVSFETAPLNENELLAFRGTSDLTSVVFAVTFDSELHQLGVIVRSKVGEVPEYLVKNDWKAVSGLSSVSVSFSASLKLITADVAVDAETSRRFAYVVRV